MKESEPQGQTYPPEAINNNPINWGEIPGVEKIWGFEGAYRNLSNHSPFPVDLNGRIYGNVAHAYEALRFEPRDTEAFMGRIPGVINHEYFLSDDYMIEGWDGDGLRVMDGLLRVKFDPEQHPENAELLLSTGDRLLVAVDEPGRAPNGVTWGVDKNGWGNNELGVRLMEMRAEIEGRLLATIDDEGTPTAS